MWIRKRDRRRKVKPGGHVLAGLTAIAVFAAWNTGSGLFYILTSCLGSLLLISWLAPVWVLRNIRIIRRAPAAIHRGESAAVTLRVENRKFLIPILCLRMERAASPGDPVATCLRVPGQSAAVFRMTETFRMRGVHALPAMEAVSAFPFGFIECRRPVHDTPEVVVYPRLVAVREASLERGSRKGMTRAVSDEGGDEFFSLRDYQPGDEIRKIVWRASAHAGKLLVREQALSTTREVVFVLDTALPDEVDGAEAAFERIIELVASLAVDLLNRGYTVALLTANTFLEGGEGKAHALKILDRLARVSPDDTPSGQNFDWVSYTEETARALQLFASTDPRLWGAAAAPGTGAVLDPRAVTHA